MSNDRVISFRVVLPAGTITHSHRPGDSFCGKVSLTVGKPFKALRLRLQFIGMETVHVAPQSDTHALFSSTRVDREIFNIDHPIWGCPDCESKAKKQHWEDIPVGTHEFDFCINLPRVNFAPSISRNGICQVQYTIQAHLDRPGSFFNSIISSNKEEILLTPIIFPTQPQAPFTHTDEKCTNKGECRVALEYEANKSQVCPGDIVRLSISARALTAGYKIRSTSLHLVEILERRACIKGIEHVAETPEFIDKWFLDPTKITTPPTDQKPRPERVTKVRANVLATFKSFIDIKIPWELNPCYSTSLSIWYELFVTVDVATTNGSLLANARHHTLQNWPRATFRVPLQVIHVNPENFTAATFANAYTDPQYNIESIRVPSALDSPLLPVIKLLGNGIPRFIAWDPSNPLWDEHMAKQNQPSTWSFLSRKSLSTEKVGTR